MHKIIHTISKKMYNINMSPSMKVHVHWVNLMKKSNHTKILKSWNFERKGYKTKDSFFNHLAKKSSMGSKCSTLGVGHMCRK